VLVCEDLLSDRVWVEKVGSEQRKATKNIPTVMESILGAEAKWL